MAVWSEVILRDCVSSDLAAEHYHPLKLQFLSELKTVPGERFGDLVVNTKDLFNPKKEIVSDGVRVYDLSDAVSSFLSLGRDPNEEGEGFESAKKWAQPGDLIVSRLRSYLKEAAIVPPDAFETLVSTEFLVLRPRRSANIQNAAFLLPFVLSEPIQTILHWSQDGNEHPRFAESVLLNLQVPQVILNEKDELSELVEQGIHSIAHSRELYAEAETLLLDALGLNDLDAAHDIAYERNFQEVARAGRFDAQYFSPRAQRAMEIMGRSGQTLGGVAPLAKRQFKPQSGEAFHYIEIGDLSGDGRAEASPVFGEDAASRAQWIVRPRDVITSTVRPIRRLSALIEPHQDDFVCSSGFAVLEPSDVEPELLLVYLRAPIVSEILDLHTTATMYPAIATDVLLDVPFSAPDASTTAQIVAKVHDSRAAHDEAQNLLETAKRRVEELIEEGAVN